LRPLGNLRGKGLVSLHRLLDLSIGQCQLVHLELLLHLAHATAASAGERHDQLPDAQVLEGLQNDGPLNALHRGGQLGELGEAGEDDLKVEGIAIVDLRVVLDGDDEAELQDRQTAEQLDLVVALELRSQSSHFLGGSPGSCFTIEGLYIRRITPILGVIKMRVVPEISIIDRLSEELIKKMYLTDLNDSQKKYSCTYFCGLG